MLSAALALLALAACGVPADLVVREARPPEDGSPTQPAVVLVAPDAIPLSDGFDLPVGPPDAVGYYDAQPIGGDRGHLGSDWNGNGGGDSDLGDPIYAAAGGVVSAA